MSISFTCSCGKRMKAPDNLAGKKVKCGGCKKITVVPYPSCNLDEARLALLRPFMATDVAGADPDGFPLGCISTRTVVYACGAIGKEGDAVEHTHSYEEMKLCRRLAEEAAKVAVGLDAGTGSEGAPPRSAGSFSPFFITANIRDKIVRNLSEDFVRKKFGGVIFPPCPIRVEPLREKGEWWESVLKDCGGSESRLNAWRKLIEWFNAHKEFQETAHVKIGKGPQDGGCRFPRLALGFTSDGSLAGVLGIDQGTAAPVRRSV